MRVPNAERAVIPRDKIEGYALHPDHDVGKHKARVFASALGIHRGNADLLREALLAAVRQEVCFDWRHNGYGMVYEMVFSMVGPGGTADVLAAWYIEDGTDIPSLISCRVVT